MKLNTAYLLITLINISTFVASARYQSRDDIESLLRDNINYPNYDNMRAISETLNLDQKLFDTKFGGPNAVEQPAMEERGAQMRTDSSDVVLPLIGSSFDEGVDGVTRSEPAKQSNGPASDVNIAVAPFADGKPFTDSSEISRIKSMYNNPHENVIKYLEKRNHVLNRNAKPTRTGYPDDEAIGAMLKSFEADDVQGNIFHRGHNSNFDLLNPNRQGDESSLSTSEKEIRDIFGG